MNNNKFPHLTSPIQLGKVTFRNRIFSAPIVFPIRRLVAFDTPYRGLRSAVS